MSTLETLIVVAAYLFGSISTAILTCRLMGLPDPRTQGSGNPGATNVLRVGGKQAAAVTLIGDMLKGLVPMLLAGALGVSDAALALTGLAAFFGHLYPVFFGFKGGKGVATALGVLLGISWWIGLATIATWLFVAFVLRISSLAALVAMFAAPFFVWWLRPDTALLVATSLMSLVLFWRHRSNIAKLLSGTEDRITDKD